MRGRTRSFAENIAALKADGTVNTLIEKWFEGMEGPY